MLNSDSVYVAVDTNYVSSDQCGTYYGWWGSTVTQDVFYLNDNSGITLWRCFSTLMRINTWSGTDWSSSLSSVSAGQTGISVSAASLDSIVYNSKPVYSLNPYNSFHSYGYSSAVNNTVLLEATHIVDLADTIIEFGSDSTTSDGTPRYGFAAGVDPLIKLQLQLPECYGVLPLEGETSTGCDPYEYQLKLSQGETALETWNVTQGIRTVSPLGYLSWQTPSASSNEYTPFVFLRLPAATSTDTSYTLEVYNADGTELISEQDVVVGLPLVVPDNQEEINSFCASVPHSMTGKMIGFAYDFDFHTDDICSLIIPPDNYLSGQVSGIKTNFFAKFAFLGQLSELFNSGLSLFSDSPTIPADIVFTWQSTSYTFLDFGPISDYADDMRNYSGLIMWAITIVVILQVINSAFTPSKEDDLI